MEKFPKCEFVTFSKISFKKNPNACELCKNINAGSVSSYESFLEDKKFNLCLTCAKRQKNMLELKKDFAASNFDISIPNFSTASPSLDTECKKVPHFFDFV